MGHLKGPSPIFFNFFFKLFLFYEVKDRQSWNKSPAGIVIYLHIEGALYAQKSVPSWFLAVFDSKIDVCWNLKKVVNFLIH